MGITAFGKWVFSKNNYTLTFGGYYEIDLETITDSAKMLDIIFQVQGKSWATESVLYDLLRALITLLNPQRNLCPGGWNETTISPAGIIDQQLSSLSSAETEEAVLP